MVLLYGIGGNSYHEKARSVIKALNLYITKQPMFSKMVKTDNKEQIRQVSFLFFTDADEDGVEHQERVLRREYGQVLSNLEELCHKSILQCAEHLVGCYVFSDGSGKGKLENVTLPLFRQDHEKMFDDIEIFWETHHDKTTKKARKHKMKSVIGIAGQLHEPGFSNEVIIRQSGYITDDKIKKDSACLEIIDFFNRMFDKVLSVE